MTEYLHLFRNVYANPRTDRTVTGHSAVVCHEMPRVRDDTIGIYQVDKIDRVFEVVASHDTLAKLVRVVEWHEQGCPEGTGVTRVHP